MAMTTAHVLFRCDRCGKVAAPHQITPAQDDPPREDCGCYMGPRWVRGVWMPEPYIEGEKVLGVPPGAITKVARWFHEAYERLAPARGYTTRPESSVPWEDVPADNRLLMFDTVAVVLGRLTDEGDVRWR